VQPKYKHILYKEKAKKTIFKISVLASSYLDTGRPTLAELNEIRMVNKTLYYQKKKKKLVFY
jgi:hypothetical protein